MFGLTTMAVFAVSFIGPEAYLGIDEGAIAWRLTLLVMAWAFSRGRVAYSFTSVGTKHRTNTRTINQLTGGFVVAAAEPRTRTGSDDDT